jgi:transcription elongation GreA/GreB family factor
VNKQSLHDQIIERLRAELRLQAAAAQMARDEAISEESRPENKYDTHSQEAAYLAEGQARLAAEIQASLSLYQSLSPQAFSATSPISTGAVVELVTGTRHSWYFLGPRAGGLELDWGGKAILLITPQSPLGRQLLGRVVGDTLHLSGKRGQVEHRITTVL